MTIALLDCNNFFASCERVFNPAYVGKPVVVLSNNDGCVIARSNEAKQLGIPMGIPYFKVRDLCDKHRVIIHSSNFKLYGDMSSRVMASLKMLVPEMQIYSIDEAFFDLSGFKDPTKYALEIRSKILKWTGIPVSIGIASTKTLAKAANHIAKKLDLGVFNFYEQGDRDKILEGIGVNDVWGVGIKTASNLEQRCRIGNALQLKRANPVRIRKSFSVLMQKTILELNGVKCFGLRDAPRKKFILSSRSFGKPVIELKDLEEAIASYAAIAARKLREQGGKAYGLWVYVKTNKFNKHKKYYSAYEEYTFALPTSNTADLTIQAKKLLKQVYKSGEKYKKAGVILHNIVDEDRIQNNLFEIMDLQYEEKGKKLMKVMDKLNVIFGKKGAFLAAEGIKQSWRMKSNLRTPQYTTDICQIPCVS